MKIEAIKEAIKESDIVGIIGQYVHLKKRGNNWVGLCPFHKEKTPSFNVSEKRKIYKCFGCGKSGDVVTFLRDHKNYSFNDAIKEIGVLDSDSSQIKQMNAPLPLPPKVLHFIDPKFLTSSLKNYTNNCFVIFLLTLFDEGIVIELITKTYHVGTSKKFWNGATAFWQVDKNIGIRQVKIILYDPLTGNRRKWKVESDQSFLSSTSQRWIIDRKMDIVQWGKQLLKKVGVKEPEIVKCFFGEHLLSRFPDMKVAIVESEKTAILMAGFSELGLPIAEDYIWLATGGANGIDFTNYHSIKVLEDREVVLFPDLEKYEDWAISASSIEGVKIEVSNLLENIATKEEREKGEDISDYFLREYLAGNFNEVVEAPNIISRYEQVFNDFNSKNPMVGELISKLNLKPS